MCEAQLIIVRDLLHHMFVCADEWVFSLACVYVIQIHFRKNRSFPMELSRKAVARRRQFVRTGGQCLPNNNIFNQKKLIIDCQKMKTRVKFASIEFVYVYILCLWKSLATSSWFRRHWGKLGYFENILTHFCFTCDWGIHLGIMQISIHVHSIFSWKCMRIDPGRWKRALM